MQGMPVPSGGSIVRSKTNDCGVPSLAPEKGPRDVRSWASPINGKHAVVLQQASAIIHQPEAARPRFL